MHLSITDRCIQNQDLNVIKKFYKFLEIFILFGTVSPISAESS